MLTRCKSDRGVHVVDFIGIVFIFGSLCKLISVFSASLGILSVVVTKLKACCSEHVTLQHSTMPEFHARSRNLAQPCKTPNHLVNGVVSA